jgi:hypothetical protein
VDGHAAAFEGRRIFLGNPQWLSSIKARIRAKDPALLPAYTELLARADAALDHAAYTVVNKKRVPPSGDRHDYYSIGPYWWPDPKQPDGLPYFRKDGQVNPERNSDAFDTANMGAMSTDVDTLALAYFFTDDPRYARHAAMLLRAWFIDAATRMNPNLNYSQAVPGRFPGRGEGIIDAARLLRVVEAIGLLAPSVVLSAKDQRALEAWFGELVRWMATSKPGGDERAKENNHGIYYDLLTTDFALFARKADIAKQVVSAAPEKRFAQQIAADGSLPQELTRTRSLHYSHFALGGAFDLATLAECVGVDLWHYQTPDGRGLRKAVDFLVPYAGREQAWPYPEMKSDSPREGGDPVYYNVFMRAAWVYESPLYAAAAEHYAAPLKATPISLRMPVYSKR